MPNCTRCGWSAPAGATICQRCGQTLAAAAPPRRPKLVLRLQAPNLPAEMWEVTDTVLGIGRLDNSDIAIPDKSVSRQHARIVPTPTGFDVEDLGSVNGTWLNDEQVSDRSPLNNGDRLMIGDVPLLVELRHEPAPIAPVQPAPVQPSPSPYVPQPLPAPPIVGGGRVQAGAPSTVFYDIDEALAATPPVDAPRPFVEQVPAAHEVTPARPMEPPPPMIIEATVHPAGPIDQPTLVAGEGTELEMEPLPANPAPLPAPSVEPIIPPSRPAGFVPAFEPRPATPAWEPQPAPPREITPPTRTWEPQPSPPREITPPTRTWEPQPATPRDVAPPTPTLEPQPAPPRPVLEPQPGPPRQIAPTRPASEAQPAPVPVTDLSATQLIELADKLAAGLRLFKGDAALALWLFEHAGGQPAVQAFGEQVRRLQGSPSDANAMRAVLELAPTAASLLEAAVLLANVVSSLGPHTPSDEESKANASNLQPVSRA